MSTFPQTQPTKGSDSQAPASAGRGRPSRVRYRPWNQGSRRALAMLRLFPVEAAPLPRVHLEAAGADSGLQVFDRPTGQRLLVYTPRFNTQFQAGHRAGRWYVRPVNEVGSEPRGPGFATARDAIEAVTAGRWSFAAILAERTTGPLRVIWPPRDTN